MQAPPLQLSAVAKPKFDEWKDSATFSDWAAWRRQATEHGQRDHPKGRGKGIYNADNWVDDLMKIIRGDVEHLSDDEDLFFADIEGDIQSVAYAIVGESYENFGELDDVLECASPEVRGLKEVMIEAVKQYPSALKYARRHLRADREIVLEAVRRYPEALQYASPELQADKEMILEAVKQDIYQLDNFGTPELASDKHFMMEAATHDGFALKWCSPALKADKELVLVAVKQDGDSIRFADRSLRADPDVALEVVINWKVSDGVGFLGANLLGDKDFVLRSSRLGLHSKIPYYQTIISQEKFDRVMCSYIATSGEEHMPVISVKVIRTTNDWGKHYLNCQATLLSGVSSNFEFPEDFVMDKLGNVRPSPTLDDLAKELSVWYLGDRQVELFQQRVFLVMLTSSSTENPSIPQVQIPSDSPFTKSAPLSPSTQQTRDDESQSTQSANPHDSSQWTQRTPDDRSSPANSNQSMQVTHDDRSQSIPQAHNDGSQAMQQSPDDSHKSHSIQVTNDDGDDDDDDSHNCHSIRVTNDDDDDDDDIRVTNDDDSHNSHSIQVTPWEWERPVADFVTAN